MIGIGVDVEAVQRFGTPPRAAFSSEEVRYCLAQAASAEAFAGTWCAKEATVKALSAWGVVSLRSVEVFRDADGAPYVRLLSGATEVSSKAASPTVHVSIAHTTDLAVAVAVAVSSEPAD